MRGDKTFSRRIYPDMSQTSWLCLMPHPYGWGDNQGRDIGALANGLRQLGERVEFYVLDERTDVHDPSVKLAGFQQLAEAQWWKSKGCGVLLTTFGTRLMQPIYAAAKQAGWSVWTRMDCDEIPGPDGKKSKYIVGRMVESIDRRRRKNCDLSGTISGGCEGFLRAATGIILASRIRARLLRSYELADRLLVETPLAEKSFREYFGKRGRKDLASKIRVLSPAISEAFYFSGQPAKTGVVAVGQWFRWQKNLHLLADTILKTWQLDADLQWTVVGNGAHFVEEALEKREGLATRNARFKPHTKPEELADIYRSARVIFYSSRQEGFPNTLCEALCSGTTMVAPGGIQAFEYCEARGWGSLYDKPIETPTVVLDELAVLKAGRRDPQVISAQAATLFHRKNVATQLCNLRQTLSQRLS